MKQLKAFEELTATRFFAGDRKKRAAYIKRFPDRWENDSAFIRAACQYFMRTLDKEPATKRTRK